MYIHLDMDILMLFQIFPLEEIKTMVILFPIDS